MEEYNNKGVGIEEGEKENWKEGGKGREKGCVVWRGGGASEWWVC